jgi:predicted amidohydrolase
MARLVVSLGQMNIAFGDPRRNLKAAEEIAVEASRRGTHLLVLPELWTTSYALDRARELAEPLNGETFNQVGALAANNRLAIVGSMLERRGSEVANSAPFFSPRGQAVGVYRKLHLFRLLEEDRHLQRGSAPLSMDLPWGNTAIAICYDLRFPELFRKYAVGGSKVIIVPAEWPIERLEHWRALLIARAIENQCYIIACNACGESGPTTYAGHSMIVDPWGRIVIEVGESPTLATAEIETDLVDQVRARIPVFEDRRTDVYA